MFRYHFSACFIVTDNAFRSIGDFPLQRNNRYADTCEFINVYRICTEDNPRNPVALAYFQIFLLLGSIRFGTEYIKNIALFIRFQFQIIQKSRKKRLIDIGHDYPDTLWWLLWQRSRDLIRLIVQLLHGSLNLFMCFTADIPTVIQCSGNRRHRQPALLCNIL